MITVFGEVFLALIMLIAGVLKLISFNNFINTLKELGIFFPRIAAVFIISLELVSGFALLETHTRFLGEIGLLILNLFFSISIFLALRKKKRIECNCFGRLLPSYFGWNLAIRFLVIFSLTIYIFFSDNYFNLTNLYYLDIICIILITFSILLFNLLIQTLINYLAVKNKNGGN